MTSDALIGALRKERQRGAEAEQKVRRLQERVHALNVRITELTDTTTQLSQANSDLAEEVTTTQLDLARANVLHTKQVPDRLADYVTGSTPEQLEVSADKVLSTYERIAELNTPLGLSTHTQQMETTSMANTQSQQVWEDYRARKEGQEASMAAKVQQLQQPPNPDPTTSFTESIGRTAIPDGHQLPDPADADLDPHRPLGHTL